MDEYYFYCNNCECFNEYLKKHSNITKCHITDENFNDLNIFLNQIKLNIFTRIYVKKDCYYCKKYLFQLEYILSLELSHYFSGEKPSIFQNMIEHIIKNKNFIEYSFCQIDNKKIQIGCSDYEGKDKQEFLENVKVGTIIKIYSNTAVSESYSVLQNDLAKLGLCLILPHTFYGNEYIVEKVNMTKRAI